MLLYFLTRALVALVFILFGALVAPIYFELKPLFLVFIFIEALAVTVNFELEPVQLLFYFNLAPCFSSLT